MLDYKYIILAHELGGLNNTPHIQGFTSFVCCVLSMLRWVPHPRLDLAAIFIPMPLPNKVLQTSYCTHLF